MLSDSSNFATILWSFSSLKTPLRFTCDTVRTLNSTVPLQYLREGHVEDFKLPLVPFEDKSALSQLACHDDVTSLPACFC